MMGEELLLSPEITMREEPGEITIGSSGNVAIEIDDDEPEFPFANGEIPPEISITKVTGSSLAQLTKGRPMLKVRNDLVSQSPPNFARSPGAFSGFRPVQLRPPPLVRAGAPLPPMPRLRFGGGGQPQRSPRPSHSPMNPLGMGFDPHRSSPGHASPRPILMPPNRSSPPPPSVSVIRKVSSPAAQQPPNHQVRFPPKPHSASPLLLQQQRYLSSMGFEVRPRTFSPRLPPSTGPVRPPPMMRPGLVPNRPSGFSHGPAGTRPVQVRTVFVPPPMRMPAAAAAHSPTAKSVAAATSASASARSSYPFANSRKSMPSAPMHARAPPLSADSNGDHEDSDEEMILDEEELDDVEPDVDPQTKEIDDVEPQEEDDDDPSGMENAKPPPAKLHLVRRRDGKGFMKKILANRSLALIGKGKKKALIDKGKKKKKPFKGLNYRFDGTKIKKRTKRSTPVPPHEDFHDSGLNDEDPERSSTDDLSVLNYLGIHRNDFGVKSESSPDSTAYTAGPKAKKSFKSGQDSDDSTYRNGSVNGGADSLKRRLSLSEALSNQKRMKVQPGVAPAGRLVRNGVAEAAKLAKELILDEEDDDDEEIAKCVCDCAKPSAELAPAPKRQGAHCQAIESVGGSRVGCKNAVTDFTLKGPRLAPDAPGSLFCSVHVGRLASHGACGFCAEFCAHGAFFMCRPTKKSAPHLFHKQCYLKTPAPRKCPHCDTTEAPLAIQLKLSMGHVPLHLLPTVSKMSFAKSVVRQSDLSAHRRKDLVSYTMPNGKVISSDGLPEGMGEEAIEKILEALDDKQNVKHTTRNMYLPTKAGDNVRLVQLLSLNYSPNQRFPEAEGGSPLHVAASEGLVLTAHILVQAGAELDNFDDEQNTPLMLACMKGRSDVARYLLQSGADVTIKGDDGMTCLHLAAQNGHLECVHAILSQTNKMPRNFMNRQDEGGWTPLVWACENKHEDVIGYLIERGADPLITDAEGNIALHWAALSGSRSTCELLLNAGCDVNETNSIGETPLHIALRQDHYDCAVLFIMRRARLDVKNKNGMTPAECMVNKDSKAKNIVRLGTMLQQLMGDSKTARSERIVANDLTKGKETVPIQCVNCVDDESEPNSYVYVSKNCITASVPIDKNIAKLQHCTCTGTCATEDTCHCSDLSVKSWYDMEGRLKEGFDYKEPPMIFECNDMCKCSVSLCHNRVLQHGITVRLQVHRTDGMGWGVRPLTDIPKGTFVCEYVGEIISDSEADTREDSYLFDLDNRDGDTFCLDANRYGNIARFINHSCSPNLVPVKVFAEHQDLRFPHIALFASRNIAKGEELGFDYGEKFWVIKHKWFTCNCNSEKCRYNRASIQTFLKEYYERTGEEIATATSAATSSKVKKEVKTEATVKVEAVEAVPAQAAPEAAEGTSTSTEDSSKTKRAFKKPSTVERPKRVKKQEDAAK